MPPAAQTNMRRVDQLSEPSRDVTRARRSIRLWPAFFCLWTLIGLTFAGQFYISSSQFGRPIPWRQALIYSLTDWYVFACLSLVPIFLSKRLRLEGRKWKRNVGLHLLASIGFSIAYVIIRASLVYWQPDFGNPAQPYGNTVLALLLKTWHFNLLIYWVVLTVSHAVDFYQRYQDRATRTAELEKRLVEARLQALQIQLNPHFLFNTLHAISALMHQDVDAADRMITRLGELLRHALESTDQQEVPLSEELDFLKRYLEIEQTRFGDRIQIQLDIAPDTSELLVPNLILQPLVENAIQHGIEPNARPGKIVVHASRADETLTLRVSDSGAGDSPKPFKEGVGLSNTRSRLRQLYGERQTFVLEAGLNGGVRATITLPCRAVS